MTRRHFPLCLAVLCALLTGGIASANEKLSSAELFRKVSPSVVLLVGKGSLGSGSLINETDILTNWHVVDGNKRILVAFKPKQEGVNPTEDDMVVGNVIRFDRSKDLALVRVKEIPAHVGPLSLADQEEIEIGADVHAIGHPRGTIWTYTKGVISQFRKGFEWQYKDSGKMKADVIQTQTPINPGNSGGPLLSDRGRLVGVNSFGASGAEGLNFAVALGEVHTFLGDLARPRPASGGRAPKPAQKQPEDERPELSIEGVKARLVYQGRDKDNEGYLREYELFGKSGGSYVFFYPDDQDVPAYCFVYAADKLESVVIDLDRDGKWDVSAVDTTGNGRFDSVGIHKNGKLKSTSRVAHSDPKAPASVKQAMPGSVPEAGKTFVPSPSFECAAADTLVKQTVCAHERLADLDVTVDSLYNNIIENKESMRGAVQKGQADWVAGTEKQCRGDNAAACIEGRYKQRVIYLNVLLNQ